MRERPVRISGHARFEMGRRGISEAQVVGVVRRPGQMILSRKGRQIYQTKIAGGRMLPGQTHQNFCVKNSLVLCTILYR